MFIVTYVSENPSTVCNFSVSYLEKLGCNWDESSVPFSCQPPPPHPHPYLPLTYLLFVNYWLFNGIARELYIFILVSSGVIGLTHFKTARTADIFFEMDSPNVPLEFLLQKDTYSRVNNADYWRHSCKILLKQKIGFLYIKTI